MRPKNDIVGSFQPVADQNTRDIIPQSLLNTEFYEGFVEAYLK